MVTHSVVFGCVLARVAGHGMLTGSRQGGVTSCAGIKCDHWINGAPSYQVGPDAANHYDGHTIKDVELPAGVKAENCATTYRTCGSSNGCGGSSDKKPWHAPGNAPVSSPCGLNPSNNKRGETLSKMETMEWAAGSTAVVSWAPYINHGGGYAYRLCKKSKSFNEQCFQATHLEWADDQTKLVDRSGRTFWEGSANTTSAGSSNGKRWRMNPIPKDSSYFSTAHGYATERNSKYSIVDIVKVPATLSAGEYWLSWRWDCECNWQVFSQCGDVKITKVMPSPTDDTQCRADFGTKMGDRVCCDQDMTYPGDVYICPKSAPKCVDFVKGQKFGFCTTPCRADFGTQVGDPVCCGQDMTYPGDEFICPESAPTCVNFVKGQGFGACTSASVQSPHLSNASLELPGFTI